MDVDEFLRELGLQQYEAAFRKNDADAGVLSNLTTDDLKELGVVTVGHRRQLLVAIAALRAGKMPSGSIIQFFIQPSILRSPHFLIEEDLRAGD
jgi:SAM domain (Sterile alpha motif)